MLRTMMGRTMRACCILVVTGSAANAQSGVAENDAVRATKWTSEQAEAAGWVSRTMDFGAANLGYTTVFPKDAKIQTTTVKGDSAGLGNITIVGKYVLPSAGVDITATVMAYRLRVGGSALRLCNNTLRRDGYLVQTIDDLNLNETHAQILSLSLDKQGKPQEGVLSDCRTRGNTVLNHHFFIPLADAADDATINERIGNTGDVFNRIISDMAFTDGKPDGYGDSAVPVTLTLSGRLKTIRTPDVFRVTFNDFDGRKGEGQRELHLMQKKDGLASSIVWLGESDMPQKPDLAKVGPENALRRFSMEAAQMPELELVSNKADDRSSGNGITVQKFVFSVTSAPGDGAGSLVGEAWWHDGKVYVLTWFSAYDDDDSLKSYIARLPGETAYALVRKITLGTLQ
ncbi:MULTISPECIES: hypothetical protein [Rhizobium]|uniref:hypothetical protein n=1 Tax=Rhizobium TaxID=379 RepID=UPI0012E7A531|nr:MULTISPECIES: hypothetical protein [Rhizobium]NTF34080.1 hypothetical protein [Rhizobium skierniewicense]